MRRTGPRKILMMGMFAAGCGGNYTPAPNPPPLAQNAVVSGQYSLRLTSTNGHGTTNINTNFTQTGKTFSGASNTLVCPSSDLSQCIGGDAAVTPITPTGTVNGTQVSIAISFPSGSETRTLTMIGTVSGSASGTYTDNLGDVGTWTASSGNPLSATFTGTFNSTSHPLTIPPTISISLLQDASFNLTGTATIMSSPCIAALTLTGQAIGQAFIVNDAANQAQILALPNGNDPNFSYKFAPTAPHCTGDSGIGVIAIQAGPWDY